MAQLNVNRLREIARRCMAPGARLGREVIFDAQDLEQLERIRELAEVCIANLKNKKKDEWRIVEVMLKIQKDAGLITLTGYKVLENVEKGGEITLTYKNHSFCIYLPKELFDLYNWNDALAQYTTFMRNKVLSHGALAGYFGEWLNSLYKMLRQYKVI